MIKCESCGSEVIAVTYWHDARVCVDCYKKFKEDKK
jgi:DNA-directed RNA polymerase subunit RPC12/RpoP